MGFVFALNKDGDPQYYTFSVTSGQRVHVILLKSMEANDSSFIPMVAILGPGLKNQGTLLNKVALPSGYNWQAISSGHPVPTCEPFSPGSFFGLSDTAFNVPSTGQYYVVVYENSSTPTGGHYGLTIGDRESYTIDEWVLLPVNLINIYSWGGQTFLE